MANAPRFFGGRSQVDYRNANGRTSRIPVAREENPRVFNNAAAPNRALSREQVLHGEDAAGTRAQFTRFADGRRTTAEDRRRTRTPDPRASNAPWVREGITREAYERRERAAVAELGLTGPFRLCVTPAIAGRYDVVSHCTPGVIQNCRIGREIGTVHQCDASMSGLDPHINQRILR